jgi:hypothetical protein
MTQSVPSSTALATSVASARVGRGLLLIDSSICVAVMTGLPAWLHCWIIIFCARKIFSVGISIPRSPRATCSQVFQGELFAYSPCGLTGRLLASKIVRLASGKVIGSISA